MIYILKICKDGKNADIDKKKHYLKFSSIFIHQLP